MDPYFLIETTLPEDGSHLPRLLGCRRLSIFEDRLQAQECVKEGFEKVSEVGDYSIPLSCVHKIRLVQQ
jgi:hypothetical protein